MIQLSEITKRQRYPRGRDGGHRGRGCESRTGRNDETDEGLCALAQ